VVATVWEYLAQSDQRAPIPVLASTLGALLRELHRLPPPPFSLPSVDPLGRLRRAIAQDGRRSEPVLTSADLAFLNERMTAATSAYQTVAFPLGRGLIHNDAHLGNLLTDEGSPYGYVLADWDSACAGPHEIDLVQEGAPGNRFGESTDLRQAFSHGYGYDISNWPGWKVLRELRDLHSLAAYIRTAPTKPAAGAELRLRLATLQTGERTHRWHAVP
jgi:aminoglycoside phosphotransferase (APT) family kinase protein